MRLADEASAAVDATIGAVLDRRLQPASPRPVCIALSGGGDSAALLLAARDWAGRRGRRLVALTVDHRLQPQSRAWTESCAALAARLGVGFQALAWEGDKPIRGLPAAARAARHRLLAEAARQAGAYVLLLGHTADDRLEASAMRAAGATTPEPREWAPSPAWPEGRGLVLLRPMLGLRRAALRAWLAARDETWIEDPANADPRFARARARAGLDPAEPPAPPPEDPPLALAGLCRVEPWGAVRLDRQALRAAPAEDAARLVALAAVCAGGGARAPSAQARGRLAEALRHEAAVAATLCGARIEADVRELLFVREAGEAARGGLAPLALAPDTPAVWDGRFELVADRPGLQVRRLAGLARRLAEPERRALARIPAAARPGLPVVVDAAGDATCPLLAPGIALVSLVEDRLRAAAGLIEREPV